jgi:hypothetical protein
LKWFFSVFFLILQLKIIPWNHIFLAEIIPCVFVLMCVYFLKLSVHQHRPHRFLSHEYMCNIFYKNLFRNLSLQNEQTQKQFISIKHFCLLNLTCKYVFLMPPDWQIPGKESHRSYFHRLVLVLMQVSKFQISLFVVSEKRIFKIYENI